MQNEFKRFKLSLCYDDDKNDFKYTYNLFIIIFSYLTFIKQLVRKRTFEQTVSPTLCHRILFTAADSSQMLHLSESGKHREPCWEICLSMYI